MNTMPKVFDSTNLEHYEFKPVYEWILYDIGRVVIGGTSYMKELKRMNNYLRIINLLNDKKKVIKVIDLEVDTEEYNIINFLNDCKCDDPHIIALLKVSQCKLLCSNDDRMFPYIKRTFTKNRPKIYYSLRNKSVLTKTNIPKIYQN